MGAAPTLAIGGGALRRRASFALPATIGPAYAWLLFTVFLPLSAMLYFSFLSDVPFGEREAAFSLEISLFRFRGYGNLPLPAIRFSMRADIGEIHQGKMARSHFPAHHPAILEQRFGPRVFLDYGASRQRST